jgi:hypothetical protein
MQLRERYSFLLTLMLHAGRAQNYPRFLGLSPQNADGMLAADEFVPLTEERLCSRSVRSISETEQQ